MASFLTPKKLQPRKKSPKMPQRVNQNYNFVKKCVIFIFKTAVFMNNVNVNLELTKVL